MGLDTNFNGIQILIFHIGHCQYFVFTYVFMFLFAIYSPFVLVIKKKKSSLIIKKCCKVFQGVTLYLKMYTHKTHVTHQFNDQWPLTLVSNIYLNVQTDIFASECVLF